MKYDKDLCAKKGKSSIGEKFKILKKKWTVDVICCTGNYIFQDN